MKVSLNKLTIFSVAGPGMVSPLFKLIVILGIFIRGLQSLNRNRNVSKFTYRVIIFALLAFLHSSLVQIIFLNNYSFSGFFIKLVGILIFLVAYRTPSRIYSKYIFYILALSEIIIIIQYLNFTPVLMIYPADAPGRYSGFVGASTLVGLAAILKLMNLKMNPIQLTLHLPISLFCCYASGSVAAIGMLLLYVLGMFLISVRMEFLVRVLVTMGISLTIVLTALWAYFVLVDPSFFDPLMAFSVFDAGDVKRVKLFLQLSDYLGANTAVLFTGLGIGTLISFPEIFETRHFESGLLESVSAVGIFVTLAFMVSIILYRNRITIDRYLVLGLMVLMFIFIPIFLNYFICFAIGYLLNFRKE